MAIIRKSVYNLLSVLPERSSDIIERRFGLKTGEEETLESIGQSYDVSRERVRQLEKVALAQIKERASQQAELLEFIKVARGLILKSLGARRTIDLLPRVVAETEGENQANDPKLQKAVHLVLHLYPGKIHHHLEDDEWYSFWSFDPQAASEAKKTVAKFVGKVKQRPISRQEAYEFLADQIEDIRPSHDYLALLRISKLVDLNPFEEIGHIDHPFIAPRATRDRAYLLLLKRHQPMHFVELAKDLNGMADKASNGFWLKKVTHQTTHNELIKDPRFVLIGRGIYALSEWGYKPGTVKEVILNVLKSSAKPLAKSDVIRKVLEQRKVKLATILINLQDKNYFNRNPEGLYFSNKK